MDARAREQLVPSTSTGPADWLTMSRLPFSQHVVGSLLPPNFPRYARLFHPAYDRTGEVRWAQVAEANGHVSHPAMEWASITGSWRHRDAGGQPGIWIEPPTQGVLPARQAARLASVLAAHTRTPESCWFAIWTGWAALGSTADDLPILALPGRPMVLLNGSLDTVQQNLDAFPGGQMANLWWPADHAWCVASDIDLMSTYIGAEAGVIETLLVIPELELLPVSPDQSVTWDSDLVNPLPSGHP
jgi:hypothetical protein